MLQRTYKKKIYNMEFLNPQKLTGLKKLVFKENWADEQRKNKRNSGQEYTNRGKTLVPAKFSYVQACCFQVCYINFDEGMQQLLFTEFYASGKTKQLQDVYLSSCIEKVVRRTQSSNPSICFRPNQWKYYLLIENITVPVCRQFIVSLYEISVKRIRTIQEKIIRGNSGMVEKRGSHANRPHRLEDDVVPLFYEHLNSIPSKESHYSPSTRRYFENPDLNITKLFELFKEFYHEKTHKLVKMKFNSYFKMFKTRSPVSFSQPKTDICNECETFRSLSNPNEKQQQDHDVHTALHEAHAALKRQYIKQAERDDSIFVIQFDYAQNHAMPKLNINAQFYKRLFWVYLFNIHVYNDGRSKMYLFPEGSANKDSSSVVSFLFDFLVPILESKRYRKFVMLSDNCSGQNKNQFMVKFFLWLSALYSEIEIIHIFPVVGHTFNINDSNFGLIRKNVKRVPRIVDVRVLLEKIVTARKAPSPFELLYDADLFENWAEALDPLFLTKPESVIPGCSFAIRSRSQIKFVRGQLYARSGYGQESWVKFNYFKPEVLASESFRHVSRNKAVRPGLSAAKIQDVKDLYPYLTEDEIFNLESQFNLRTSTTIPESSKRKSSNIVNDHYVETAMIPESHRDVENIIIEGGTNIEDIIIPAEHNTVMRSERITGIDIENIENIIIM